MDKRFLDRHDIAAALGRKASTVSTLVSQRRWDLVPKPLLFRGRFAWERKELELWLKSREQRPFEEIRKRGRGRPRKSRR